MLQRAAAPRPPSRVARLRRWVLGPPRDLADPSLFHRMSLVAVLAWIGLGADGLSSSSYGPDESFRALREHGNFTGLAVLLALATAATVFVLSYAYSRVMEHFPTGGGGYRVAKELLGPTPGVIAGNALLIDYVLTVTVSVASGGDALFSLLPVGWQPFKVPVEVVVLLGLVILNQRGARESIVSLAPIFGLFVITHVVLIVGGIASHATHAVAVAHDVAGNLRAGTATVGKWGLLVVFLRAYSRGGGTYTGIEAASNGLSLMREPRVVTGKRTMLYMAASLAFTAAGILVCYLLFAVHPEEGRTMNGVLVEAFAGSWRPFGLPVGRAFVVATLVSEGALLFVAAQTGFLDGPRVMASMAGDGWLPRRLASLSQRLTTGRAVVALGTASLAVLLLTRGRVDKLVVLYSINVFITFTLAETGMCRFWLRERRAGRPWRRKIAIHLVGLVMCSAILVVTLVEKFADGGWLTLLLTGGAIGFCFLVRAQYRALARRRKLLDDKWRRRLPPPGPAIGAAPTVALEAPTIVLIVREFGGLGLSALSWIQQTFADHFRRVIFVSAAIVDAGVIRSAATVETLREHVRTSLERYVHAARRFGLAADYRMAVGTDGIDEVARLCIELARSHPSTVFFAGEVAWESTGWHRFLDENCACAVQRRLQCEGVPLTVLPLPAPHRDPRLTGGRP